MKKTLLFIGLAVFAVLSVMFVARILTDEDSWICQKGEWVKHGNPASPKPSTPCGTKSEVNQNQEKDILEEAIPAPANQQSESGNIIVNSPVSGEAISSPVVIKGSARVFENQFSLRIKDSTGKILASKNAYANSPDIGQFGDFSETVNFSQPSQDSGTIEIFDNSPKDGAEIDLVSIPVSFK